MKIRSGLLSFAFTLLFAATASAQTYIPPTNHRVDTIINSNWRFIRQDVAGATNTTFDDSSWTNLNLPMDLILRRIAR